MSDQTHKSITDESDPQRLAERSKDLPGSFLKLYRSQDLARVETDESFVDKSVKEGIIPESIRYGVMRRGQMMAFRGVVKSTQNEMFYFNWHEGGQFKIVPADDVTKSWEAEKLFKTCPFGCDLIRRSYPLDSGEAVNDADDETEKAGEAAEGFPSSESGQQFANEQPSISDEVHPGATFSGDPDDPARGRDWHSEEAVTRAVDAAPIAKDGGHWNTHELVKAVGRKLQETAPRLAPRADAMETQYMQEVLGASARDIEKGVTLAPRHRVGFEQWKAGRLRDHLGGMQSWLRRKS